MDKDSVPYYFRAIDAEEAEQFRAQTEAGDYDLTRSESWWRDRSQILDDHGYQLRSRLMPGWTPSWKDTDINPLYCEDSLSHCTRKVVDAVRKSDGKDVAVMNLHRDSRERLILLHIQEAQKSTGKDQHIVPILDSFKDDREPDLEFFVMPLLRKYYLPPFEAISEVVDFTKQLLEGLAFMHSVGVAHRDCSNGNIMMDAPSMFPNGFHPCDATRDRDGIMTVKSIPRYKAAGPIKYYFIDFGISSQYDEGDERIVIGNDGADRDVPELSNLKTYNPFPADVFIVGNVLKKRVLPEYTNLTFLSPLVDAMTAKEPSERPSAEDALKRFKSIISSQSYFTLRHRLVKKDEVKGFKSVVFENVGIFVNAALLPVKFVIGIPSQTFNAVRGFVGSKSPKKKTT